jgi:hypothetical protein
MVWAVTTISMSWHFEIVVYGEWTAQIEVLACASSLPPITFHINNDDDEEELLSLGDFGTEETAQLFGSKVTKTKNVFIIIIIIVGRNKDDGRHLTTTDSDAIVASRVSPDMKHARLGISDHG